MVLQDPNLPTIDTTQEGTLTINKYEGTDENTSNDKPLAGVEFYNLESGRY